MDIYLRMLAPVCPHIAEELWTNVLGKPYSVHTQAWPQWTRKPPAKTRSPSRCRSTANCATGSSSRLDASEEQIQSAALASEAVQKFLEGKPPRKVIVAQKKLVNIVM